MMRYTQPSLIFIIFKLVLLCVLTYYNSLLCPTPFMKRPTGRLRYTKLNETKYTYAGAASLFIKTASQPDGVADVLTEEPATWLRPSPIGVKVGMSKGFFHAQVALEQVSTGARVYGVHKFCVIPGEVDLVRFEQRSSSVQSYKETFQKKY